MSGQWTGKRPAARTHRSSDDTIACQAEVATLVNVRARSGIPPASTLCIHSHQFFSRLRIIHWSCRIIACDYDSCCTRLGITRCIHGLCRASRHTSCAGPKGVVQQQRQQQPELIFNTAAHICPHFDSSSTPTRVLRSAGSSDRSKRCKTRAGRVISVASVIKGGRIGQL